MKITVRKDLRSQRTSKHRRNYAKSKTRLKKAAYAPSKVRKMKRLTNPLSENKQVTGHELHSEIGLNNTGRPILSDFSTPPRNWPTPTLSGAGGHIMNTPHWNFIPDSACYRTHGLDENQMVGRSIWQQLTAAKCLIKWPQNAMNTGINKYGSSGPEEANNLSGIIPEHPMSYKAYWGFVPLKYLFTDETTPKANEASAQELETLVNQRVNDYFEARKNRIEFIPKRTSTLEIIGSQTLQPRWSSSTGRLPVSNVVQTNTDGGDANVNVIKEGSIPDTMFKVTWPCYKKLHLEPTNKFGDSTAHGGQTGIETTPTVFYRNYSGKIPFLTIVSWNHEKLPVSTAQTSSNEGYERERRCPQILVNDISYFRDS